MGELLVYRRVFLQVQLMLSASSSSMDCKRPFNVGEEGAFFSILVSTGATCQSNQSLSFVPWSKVAFFLGMVIPPLIGILLMGI